MCLLGGEGLLDQSRLVKRSAASFAITSCYDRGMRIVLALLCLTTAAAHADDIGYKCREAAPNTKLIATFKPTVSLHELSVWLLGFTCKNVVFSPEVAKHAQKISILAPKEMTPKQALQLFVDAVEATGLVVQQKPDTIVIKQGPNMPKSCPDLAVAPSAPNPPVPTVAPPVEAPDDDATLKALASIKKIDATHYEVPAAAIDAFTANPMAVGKGARVVPAMKNGKPEGIKLYAIRPTSLFAKVGLANGDTLLTVNGYSVASPDSALEAYTKVREAKRIDIALTRQGKPVTIVITIK